MTYPYSMYIDLFAEEELTNDVKVYLYKFSDSSKMSTSKYLYYEAVYMFKKFYPKFLVHTIILYKLKKILKKENAPQVVINKLEKIVEVLVQSSAGGYGKGK
ncbi:hypothetical protein ACIB15232_1201 [Aliarcobacter cibarius]|uniref:hypothetical protein n=1 Tax=Aliarcobacter cibarius TaxID=255507 RepID=UPI001245CF96|nr:hypothetical protein [Aliarcobacter cibarius]QEZ89313.1 hypothetical protein ACIB15232_1201 [Aliarcobacter cibarius]